MSEESLVAKRLRYIERQKALHQERVNVAFADRAPAGSGPANRHGMPKLPVGQRAGAQLAGPRSRRRTGHRARRLAARGRWTVREPLQRDVDGVSRPAAGRRRQRLPLRDDLEPDGQPLERRPLPHPGRAGRAQAGSDARALHRLRPHARHAHPLHDQPAAGARGRRRRAARSHVGGPAAAARTRRPVPHDHAQALRLEGHEVDSEDRVSRRQPERVLGSARLLRHGRAVV